MDGRAADVVFCDVHMPAPNGLWLTGELRRRFPTTAIVLATGDSTLPPKVSMQHGVLAYLLKPFRRSAVLAATGQAAAWHADAVTRGTPAADDADHVASWLASIDSALTRGGDDG
jgi:FixJ family two-component response regulator